jgi:hypothetical protein
MPAVTRWMLRSSLIWLAVGMTIQLASPFATSLPAPLVLAGLRVFEVHALTVGWLTQLVFAVVYWMFPKASLDRPRGNAALAWFTYLCLNVGLILRAVGEPLVALGWATTKAWALPLSAALQWLAVLAFVVNTWPRVKEH